MARGGEGWGRRGVGKGLSITFQQHETRAYIMIRGCSHDHKRPIGEYLRVREEPPPTQIYCMVIVSLLHMITA